METADISQNAVEDLRHRLRAAGDEFHDLRCVLSHRLRPVSLFWSATHGGQFGLSMFRPLRRDADWWEIWFYREQDSPLLPHGYAPIRRAQESDLFANRDVHAETKVRRRLDAILGDAQWLVGGDMVCTLPGLTEFQGRLVWAPQTWLWLIFHVAWQCPGGSILRGERVFPRHHLEWCLALIEEKPYRGSQETASEIQSILDDPQDDQFISVLPVDPFTASIAMLDLVAANKRIHGDGPCGIFQWAYNGQVLADRMQEQTWRLAKYLFERLETEVSLTNLIGLAAVFTDDLTTDQTIQKQGSKASKWFEDHDIPLKITVSTTRRYARMLRN